MARVPSLLLSIAATMSLISLVASPAHSQTAGRLACRTSTDIHGFRSLIDEITFQTSEPMVTFRVSGSADEWIYSNVKKERDQDFLSAVERDGVLIFSGVRYRTPTRIDIDLNKYEVIWRSVSDEGCETVRFNCRPM